VTCKGCDRRVYSSTECQRKDWEPGGIGQGHKLWCALECGEEDIDFEVKHISPEKGRGVVALRDLPARFKILVDGELESGHAAMHPAMLNLEPSGGSFQEKIDLNSFSKAGGESVVCPRICRVNHACDPNAALIEVDRTWILFAERRIAKGEEITIAYRSTDDLSSPVPIEESREVLQIKWGIVCPQDCMCRDKFRTVVIERARQLNIQVEASLMSLSSAVAAPELGETVQGVLSDAEELLQLADKYTLSLITRMNVLRDAIAVAVMRKATLAKAVEFARQRFEIAISIGGPEWVEAETSRACYESPSEHKNYLMVDKLIEKATA